MNPIQTIKVRHNVEMAHRLYNTPGKCEAIHGHSWLVTLELQGDVDSRGLLAGLDFGLVKGLFRRYLDGHFDHKLLLNEEDPFAGNLNLQGAEGWTHLPGLMVFAGDPTTENFAYHLGRWAQSAFSQMHGIGIEVWETRVNNATWSWNARS